MYIIFTDRRRKIELQEKIDRNKDLKNIDIVVFPNHLSEEQNKNSKKFFIYCLNKNDSRLLKSNYKINLEVKNNKQYQSIFDEILNELNDCECENSNKLNIAAVKESFVNLRHNYKSIYIAKNALDKIDFTSQGRCDFLMRVVKIFEDYAKGEELGSLRDYKNVHNVEFAPNGTTTYNALCPVNGCVIQKHAHHFKSGDATTRVNACRVYFKYEKCNGKKSILIFYIGPHPEENQDFSVLF